MLSTVKFVLRTSEVKFAHHFAVRRNFAHKVNFTIEDNFTCPKGKLSFSVFSVKDNTLNLGVIISIIYFWLSITYLFLYCYSKAIGKLAVSLSGAREIPRQRSGLR